MSEPNNTYPTREQWLNAFVTRARDVFTALGEPIPVQVRVSVGFTSSGARGKAIGECWSEQRSRDATYEIFIRPTQDDASRVADILTHELCHAVAGLDAGHGAPFKRCARAVGLEGKLTATVAGEAWHSWADPILADLGPLPHAALDDRLRRKQSTRLLKVECAVCGLIARMSKQWAAVAQRCPQKPCKGRLVCDALDDDDDGDE